MKQLITRPTTVGVIVGRFQVHDLTPGHLELISQVSALHKKVLILLGSTPGVLVTRNSPLDFQTRRTMINDQFPGITVLPIRDMPNDDDWSRAVDFQIDAAVMLGTITLYGSRDSFIPFYSGKHNCVELPTTFDVSGTEIRNSLSNEIRSSRDFRHGVVYAAFNRHPVAFPTVDIALLSYEQGALSALGQRQVVLIRQAQDPVGYWRFPGGFVDPNDMSLEAAAARELREETGVCPGILQFDYIGSRRQESWRYRNEVDGITTTFFAAACSGSRSLTPGDDAVEAEWFLADGIEPILIPEHQGLGRMLQSYLKKETP